MTVCDGSEAGIRGSPHWPPEAADRTNGMSFPIADGDACLPRHAFRAPRSGQTCSDARSDQKSQSAERESFTMLCDGVETEPLPECFDRFAGLGIKASFQSKGAGARIWGERLAMSLLPHSLATVGVIARWFVCSVCRYSFQNENADRTVPAMYVFPSAGAHAVFSHESTTRSQSARHHIAGPVVA